jgi:hypothetical protein
MSPEEILVAELTTNPIIIGLVGSNVFVDAISQDTARPAIVYQRSGTDPQTTINNVQYGSFVNLLVIVHADSRVEADATMNEVRIALESVKFWQTQQSSGFESEIAVNSTAAQFTFFYTG